MNSQKIWRNKSCRIFLPFSKIEICSAPKDVLFLWNLRFIAVILGPVDLIPAKVTEGKEVSNFLVALHLLGSSWNLSSFWYLVTSISSIKIEIMVQHNNRFYQMKKTYYIYKKVKFLNQQYFSITFIYYTLPLLYKMLFSDFLIFLVHDWAHTR